MEATRDTPTNSGLDSKPWRYAAALLAGLLSASVIQAWTAPASDISPTHVFTVWSKQLAQSGWTGSVHKLVIADRSLATAFPFPKTTTTTSTAPATPTTEPPPPEFDLSIFVRGRGFYWNEPTAGLTNGAAQQSANALGSTSTPMTVDSPYTGDSYVGCPDFDRK